MQDTSMVSLQMLHSGCAQAQRLLHTGQRAEAWALLSQLALAHPQQALVPRMQAAVLSAAGQHARASGFYRAALALDPHDGPTLGAAGGCYHMLGDWPLALQHYRAALQVQCRVPKGLSKPLSASASAFDSIAAEQCLWEVLAQLARAGVHAFATSGTLLGLVREGHLLPFDKDLDLGLPFPEMGTAIQCLHGHGWQRSPLPKGMVNPVALLNKQGLTLDLCGFLVDAASGAALGGFWLQDAQADWQRVTEYPALHLCKLHRPEGTVWTLTHPEPWLTALYGPDWRTPDPDFDTVIAAHNMRGFGLVTQCYAHGRIYQRWLQGKLRKAAATTAHTLRHSPDDALLLQVQQRLSEQQAAELAPLGALSEALSGALS